MVSYLLLVGFFATIVIVGGVFGIVSDMVDTFMTSVNGAYTNNSGFTMDADSTSTGNLLLTVFKYSLSPSFIVLCYWLIQMAQKPERGY